MARKQIKKIMVKAGAHGNDKQLRFIELVATGTLPSVAARDAGYGDGEREAYRLLNSNGVKAAIRSERERHLLGECGALAINTLKNILTDSEAPAHVKLKAATWTLEACGHGGSNKADKTEESKPASEMTLAEIDAIIESGRKITEQMLKNMPRADIVPIE